MAKPSSSPKSKPAPATANAGTQEPPVRRRPAPISLAEIRGRNQDLIHLSLAAIVRELPPEVAGDGLKRLPENLRVTFPFAWIEPQLSKGSVELPRDRFYEALPGDLRPDFHLPEDANVALPLDEILLNLPGTTPFESAPVREVVFAPVAPKRISQAAETAASTVVRTVTKRAAPPTGDQSVLQSIFMTEEDLDLDKIAGLIRALPGLDGCVVACEERSVAAGDLPGHLAAAEIHRIASELFASAGDTATELGLGKLRSHTLHCEGSHASFFARQHIYLCVFHRGGRSFLPGVREKLDAVAGEMAKSM